MLPSVKITPESVISTGLPDQYTMPGEYGTLVALLNGIKAERVVEIGINYGLTAAMLLKNVSTIIHYTGIDVPPGTDLSLSVQKNEVPRTAGEYVRDDPRVRLLVREGGSLAVTPDELGPVDVVFIDGDHSTEGVVNDTLLAWEVVRPGGLVIWHDYHQLGTVDVATVLDNYAAKGHRIVHVAGTWLAYEERT